MPNAVHSNRNAHSLAQPQEQGVHHSLKHLDILPSVKAVEQELCTVYISKRKVLPVVPPSPSARNTCLEHHHSKTRSLTATSAFSRLHNMRVANCIPLLTSVFSCVYAQKTIYIDSTCTARAGWDQIWAEVKQMAESTVELFEHKERNNREDFRYIVKQLFKSEEDGGAVYKFLSSKCTQV